MNQRCVICNKLIYSYQNTCLKCIYKELDKHGLLDRLK